MNRKSSPPLAWNLLLALTCTLLLAGCGRSVPVSYYQLAPVKGEAVVGKTAAPADMVIGIGPVRLQEHLDRPQLITRTGANRLQLADRHRWAEPLAENIAWVLRENLSTLLKTEHLLLYPWERSTPVNAQVTLEILHCEGMDNGTAQLTALWSLNNRDGKPLLSPLRSSYQVPQATPDPEGLARALSEAMAQLSRDIAEELAHLQNEPPGQNP
ncbi:MAG: PqiC family protein [Desulfobulbaceae bacterium]